VGLVCPSSPAPCLPDVVLGGAVRDHGQWRVRLLVRYYASLIGTPGPGPCHGQITDKIVPGETVIVVGCFNGGSDGESFVAVLGFHPGLAWPEVLLSADCGDTSWRLEGTTLVIQSWDLKAGSAFPSARHPDVAFSWEGNSSLGALTPATQVYGANGSNFPTFCHTLDPTNT
jgi:hypothetical protein